MGIVDKWLESAILESDRQQALDLNESRSNPECRMQISRWSSALNDMCTSVQKCMGSYLLE